MTDFHDDEFEARLRAGLHERARCAPDGGPVTDEVLAAVESGVPLTGRPDHPRWRSWGMPLVAAAAVAAVVGGAVGVSHVHLDADKNPPARQSTSVPSPSAPAPAPTTAPASPSPSATVPGRGAVQLTNLHVRDLTFVGADQGWALGTADCLSGSGTCTALAYTSDGRDWGGRGTTPFNVPGDSVGCADPCVTNIRFADTSTGYAYGPSAVFLTTDGANSWRRLDGGASSLEVLAGYVLRIKPDPALCAQCGVLQRSDLGSTTWLTVPLPGATSAASVTALSTIGVKGAAVLADPDLAVPQTELYAFLDGKTWTDLGRPCQGDAVHVAGAASDGAIAVECAAHEGGAGSYPDYVTISADGGQSFGPHRTITPAGSYTDALVAASASHLLAVRDGLVRFSGDGGQSWQTVAPSGTVDFAGFESGTVGRVVTDGTTIWTTRDGGATWTSIQLP